MKAEEQQFVPGTPLAGGFYAGRVRVDGVEYALIVAPKAEGQREGAWNESYDSVPGALSYCDGLANTNAMADAGSDLAKWARSLAIGGFNDWYIPSQDELEICYRALKPTTYENSLYWRSGVNVSAVPATYPYAAESPSQTKIPEFQLGGAEAFDSEWYWSSTQHADYSHNAWLQYFNYGSQDYDGKDNEYRARVVRRLAI